MPVTAEPTTIPLQVEYPDCPHLTHGHCRWLSERFGQPHFVSPIACQFICRQHGPFAGQPLEPEAEADYTALMFGRRYNFPGGFLQRVLGKYDTQVRIAVPEQWPAIRDAMAVVEDEPWFDGVGLTGSLIVDGQTDFKDYDIVLFARDFDAIARDKHRIEAMLPDQIDGVRADYFFITERHMQFFVVLSPEEGKVYASRWFRPKVELADGLELVASDNPASDAVVEKLRSVAVPSDLAWMRVTTRQGRNVIMKSNGKSKPCGNCGKKGIQAGSNGTPPPTRPSCLECVEKHLGAAYVLITETRDGYAHRLRAIGHLHEAEDESQEWPDLHVAIREARKAYQAEGAVPDWEALGQQVAALHEPAQATD